MKIDELIAKIKQKCVHIDRVYWLMFGMLIIVATLAMFSASSTLAFSEGSTLGPILNQLLFLCAGVVVAFIVQFIPSHYIRMCGYIGLIVSIGMLLLTYTGMGVTINGATRWLRIGGIVFQPSELAKLTLIIVVSDLLSRIKKNEDEKKYFYIVLAITGFVCILILFNNLSTTILLGGIIFLLFFLARIKIKYWGTVLLIAIGLMASGYFFIKEVYVKPGRDIEAKLLQRTTTWVNRVDNMILELKEPTDTKQSLEDNYQRTIAKLAVARGGASPFGLLPGNSIERDFLPQAFADYIFAIIVEELGAIFGVGILILYMILLYRILLIGRNSYTTRGSLICYGVAGYIFIHILVNLTGMFGLFILTGVPLPFMSYGGSFTWCLIAALSLVQRVNIETKIQEAGELKCQS
jgi:cell division protein FtsW